MERNCLEFLGTWRDTGMVLAELHVFNYNPGMVFGDSGASYSLK